MSPSRQPFIMPAPQLEVRRDGAIMCSGDVLSQQRNSDRYKELLAMMVPLSPPAMVPLTTTKRDVKVVGIVKSRSIAFVATADGGKPMSVPLNKIKGAAARALLLSRNGRTGKRTAAH